MVKSIAVIDLGYGDSGKGILVARICATENIKAVIRFSGGCQAAHNVITDDNRHHTFAQFGSGTFSGVPTFLSKYMMVEPFALLKEAEALESKGVNDPWDLISISCEALMTTPYHWELNRWLEDSRGDGRHGSTGRGIGATAHYAEDHLENAPLIMDLLMLGRLEDKLSALRKWVLDQGVPEDRLPTVDELIDRYDLIRDYLNIVSFDYIEELLQEKCVFEGSQGVLLDEDYGFFPYVTRSHTTDDNMWKLIAEAGAEDPEVIGVLRAYTTRHGFGPFVAENNQLNLPELHNKYELSMGDWRVGHLDIPALQYAIDVCRRIDGLYVTHLDTRANEPNVGFCIDYLTPAMDESGKAIAKLDPFDFEARTRQSKALQSAAGIVLYQPADRAVGFISELLQRPVWGTGQGPKVSQGTGIQRQINNDDLESS